jgi:hypothetical protein
MPGMIATVLRLNEWLCDLEDFDPATVRELLADEDLTVLDAAEALGAISELEPDKQEGMRAFLRSVPPACGAAAFAAVRSALDRDLRVQVTWQPAAAFEVRVWDVSEETGDGHYRGLVNVFVLSPDPDAPSSA